MAGDDQGRGILDKKQKKRKEDIIVMWPYTDEEADFLSGKKK